MIERPAPSRSLGRESLCAHGPGLPNGAVFVEGGDDPMQVTSTAGATEYVTLVAPDHNPPLFRIEDDPPPCAS